MSKEMECRDGADACMVCTLYLFCCVWGQQQPKRISAPRPKHNKTSTMYIPCKHPLHPDTPGWALGGYCLKPLQKGRMMRGSSVILRARRVCPMTNNQSQQQPKRISAPRPKHNKTSTMYIPCKHPLHPDHGPGSEDGVILFLLLLLLLLWLGLYAGSYYDFSSQTNLSPTTQTQQNKYNVHTMQASAPSRHSISLLLLLLLLWLGLYAGSYYDFSS
jgi:hypothetical protein